MLSKNQIKEIQLLHLKKHRDNKKLFIVEGEKSVVEVLNYTPKIIFKILATSDFLLSYQTQLIGLTENLIEISEEELKKISLQNNPNKVIAICNYFNYPEATLNFNKEFSFYLDDIRDPGNFGTIIRLADWFGVNIIFCSLSSCDLYNPKVIQASMGAFLRVRVIYCELRQLLKSQQIENVYGAVLNGENLYSEPLKNGLIVIGNEANGINECNLEFINKPITIPSHQSNGTESLNAAMASAIIASEFYKKNRLK